MKKLKKKQNRENVKKTNEEQKKEHESMFLLCTHLFVIY